MEKTYNGWTNYETWNVALWLGNDGSDFDDVAKELIEDNFDPEDPRDLDVAYNRMASYLEDMVDEMKPKVTGMFADLLGAALNAVDWREIATHYINDVADEVISDLITANME
jgi:hypothetical protein